MLFVVSVTCYKLKLELDLHISVSCLAFFFCQWLFSRRIFLSLFLKGYMLPSLCNSCGRQKSRMLFVYLDAGGSAVTCFDGSCVAGVCVVVEASLPRISYG